MCLQVPTCRPGQSRLEPAFYGEGVDGWRGVGITGPVHARYRRGVWLQLNVAYPRFVDQTVDQDPKPRAQVQRFAWSELVRPKGFEPLASGFHQD